MSFMIGRQRASVKVTKSGPPTIKKFKTEPVYVKGRLEWTVTRQALESAKEGDRITSPAFKIKLPGETSKWEFRIYPKGSPKLESVYGSTVSLFVKCNKMDFPPKITLETSFIKNGENKEIPSLAHSSLFLNRHIMSGNGCRHIIKDLQELFVNDKITFVANLSFGEEERRSEYMDYYGVVSHEQTLLTNNMIEGPSSLGPLAGVYIHHLIG